ncbi:hypothetical protein Agub_g3638 [Astrephomene gubernaculifera]|uniref:Prenyltransferase alpha-alpha toroid domain-containing protein n=1 Tax=Astrephomene gubernaculifera TaxID=47775 RepID=A0AAD3DK97_9CHLO|nr:hypothetical protein Agub_g3638 [Astrephomene gubernaculifera]
MFEDGLHTATSKAQSALEKKILPFYQELESVEGEEIHEYLELHRESHVAYLHAALGQLSSGFVVLDASRTWILYWVLHSLALLGEPLPRDVTPDHLIAFLRSCQHEEGGFGGGPMQLAHTAPTYAAVASAVTLGGKALALINREKLRDFLYRMCIPAEQGGGFRVHEVGEGDLRACFTVMASAHMAGLDADKVELARRAGLAEYVRACQTYEGGLGGEPGNEAHGGYTYCGVAALLLAGGPQLLAAALDMPRLLGWLVHRQGAVEGGFNGRTNKLVDGCYSFWQGALFPLLAQLPQEALRPPPVPPSVALQLPGDLLLPDPPMMGAASPFELAEEEAQARMQEYEGLRKRAVAASEDADGALRGAAARHSATKSAAARELLDLAARAHDAAELATTQMASFNVAAFNICPPAEPEQLLLQEQQHAAYRQALERFKQHQQQGGQQHQQQEVQAELQGQGQLEGQREQHMQEAHAGQQQGQDQPMATDGTAAATPGQQAVFPPLPVPPPPLFSYEGLQLWVLKCCQASKGGLRDKPGKPVDFYHTCYCLSGLAAAQYAPGSQIMGPRANNRLRRIDPAVNVVEERLASARAYFASQPLPPLQGQQQQGQGGGLGQQAEQQQGQGQQEGASTSSVADPMES